MWRVVLLAVLLAGVEVVSGGWRRGEAKRFTRVVLHASADDRGLELKNKLEEVFQKMNKELPAGSGGVSCCTARGADETALHMFSLREPLVFLLRRSAQHHLTRGHPSTSSHAHHSFLLTEDNPSPVFESLGLEYLKFLGAIRGENNTGNILKVAITGFRERLQYAQIEREIIEEQYSDKNKSLLTTQRTSVSHNREIWSIPLLLMSHLEEILKQPNTIVLIRDYMKESYNFLDYIFDTKHFTRTYSSNEKNDFSSLDSSIGSAIVGSPLAMKNAASQLELHQLFYRVCAEHFFHQHFATEESYNQ